MNTLWTQISNERKGKVVRDDPGANWGHARYRWLSVDKRYRYLYSLYWGPEDGAVACWILFNPSPADDLGHEKKNHAYLNVMQHISKERLGVDGLTITNLFGLRDSEPDNIHRPVNQRKSLIGTENDYAIAAAVNEARYVLVAWGYNAARHPERVVEVRSILGERDLHCLGRTMHGSHPLHPGRKSFEIPVEPYSWPAEPSS
jgi:hypothetical protein